MAYLILEVLEEYEIEFCNYIHVKAEEGQRTVMLTWCLNGLQTLELYSVIGTSGSTDVWGLVFSSFHFYSPVA